MKAGMGVLERKSGESGYGGKNIQVETGEGDGIRLNLRHYIRK